MLLRSELEKKVMTLFREKMTKVFPKEIEAGSENDFYRKVRPIKQNAPRGCAQMRKEYCCKRHATRIWHTKWSKSLMNEGFRELMWTCPLCSSNLLLLVK